ncbi:putative 4-mercaptohistidine N1-methyltransferase [Verrucomicrobiales bacterium]|jgi:putative 4-mercaptohistidine N1-methyltranferase|nr:putative 4-mercaptohistidine N1-methyltransferase [Verrucomicrobiales bacterium]
MSYESDVLRDWYLLFHYGTSEEITANLGFEVAGLPPRCLEFPVTTTEAAGVEVVGRVLDLGCAVGRSSFELSKRAELVIGIDFSQSFVDAAESVRSGEALSYRRYGEMHLSDMLTASLPDGSNADRIQFEQGDAMDLREDLGSFDLVHAANLLCRLPEPFRFTDRLPALVNSGGHLIMATPATWMDQYTPRENQPEGLTLDYLKHHLGADFEMVSVQEVPFLIREHQRKLQLSTSQTSVWRRK